MKISRRSKSIPAAIAIWLFQRTLTPEEIKETIKTFDDEKPAPKRIRCPRCQWQPNASSRWYCSFSPFIEKFFGGCGTAWNTFDTQGICPGCQHQWKYTCCLSCTEYSLHEDWYENDTD